MPGWVKQGSILTQIPCSYHFTCHSSSPCTPQRSTRTSAFPWDSAVVCGFRTAYTPGKQQRGTTETDPRGKQPAPRTWQPHHTRFAGWLCWPGGGLTLTRHRGSTLTALPEQAPTVASPDPAHMLQGGPAMGAEAARVLATGRFTSKAHLGPQLKSQHHRMLWVGGDH